MTRNEQLLDHYDELRSSFYDLVRWSAYCKMSEEVRDKIADDDFAGPNKTFPIHTQQDVEHAAELLHHADDPTAVKREIIKIAHRKGLKLPSTWSHETK